MKREIITIGGNNGSGKSSTAKAVATALGYAHYSGGDFMRTLAQERNLSLAELSRLAEEDPSIDTLIDERQRAFMQTHDQFVIDSRLGFFWAPDSFKVFLKIDPEIAARRILKDRKSNALRGATESATTIEEMTRRSIERLESERLRYKTLYGIEDHTDPAHYDLVIDTGKQENMLDEVTQRVISEYQQWRSADA